MEFENLLTLIKTVSGSELTSFTMKDGDLKISMGKEKQVVVEQTGMQVMPAVAETQIQYRPVLAVLMGNRSSRRNASRKERQ